MELDNIGNIDSFPIWFRVLISDLRKKDSFPGLLHVLIYSRSSTDSYPGLLQLLIWNLFLLVVEIVVLACYSY